MKNTNNNFLSFCYNSVFMKNKGNLFAFAVAIVIIFAISVIIAIIVL